MGEACYKNKCLQRESHLKIQPILTHKTDRNKQASFCATERGIAVETVHSPPIKLTIPSDVYFSGRKPSSDETGKQVLKERITGRPPSPEVLRTRETLDQLKQELIAKGEFTRYILNPLDIMTSYTGLIQREVRPYAIKIGFQIVPGHEIQQQKIKNRWKEDPEFREKHAKAVSEYWKRPESQNNREKRARTMTELWKDPEFREKQTKATSKRAKAMAELWKDPEFREKQSEGFQKWLATQPKLSPRRIQGLVNRETGKNIDPPDERYIPEMLLLQQCELDELHMALNELEKSDQEAFYMITERFGFDDVDPESRDKALTGQIDEQEEALYQRGLTFLKERLLP